MASEDLGNLDLYSNNNVKEYVEGEKIDLFLSDKEIKGIYINRGREDEKKKC